MTTETEQSGTVLVVEDERDLATLYAKWLSSTYEVETAYSGEEALDAMDDAVDVVLLDRRLPDISGDEVLASIRSEGFDCPVAMVSAVEPAFDVIELGFDDYVVKPVDRAELESVVTELLSVDEAPRTAREHLALVAKRNALQSQLSAVELRESDEYARLTSAIDAFEKRIVSLAEAYLENRDDSLRPESKQVFEAQREQLERQLEGLSEQDLLYPAIREEIEKLDERITQPKDDQSVKRRFLEAVRDGFVAKGFWLDDRIIRALNRIFFDKRSDTLVVEKQWVEAGDDPSGRKLIVVSQAVRDLADEELS
jgi:DNA-binding response OmpR family regulator